MALSSGAVFQAEPHVMRQLTDAKLITLNLNVYSVTGNGKKLIAGMLDHANSKAKEVVGTPLAPLPEQGGRSDRAAA